MTRKEKDSLIKHLDTVLPKYAVVGETNTEHWNVSDVKAAIADFVNDDNHEKYNHYKTMVAQYDDEIKRLRAVIKTFEFIFGRELEV